MGRGGWLDGDLLSLLDLVHSLVGHYAHSPAASPPTGPFWCLQASGSALKLALGIGQDGQFLCIAPQRLLCPSLGRGSQDLTETYAALPCPETFSSLQLRTWSQLLQTIAQN